jgi:hypothetical protein
MESMHARSPTCWCMVSGAVLGTSFVPWGLLVVVNRVGCRDRGVSLCRGESEELSSNPSALCAGEGFNQLIRLRRVRVGLATCERGHLQDCAAWQLCRAVLRLESCWPHLSSLLGLRPQTCESAPGPLDPGLLHWCSRLLLQACQTLSGSGCAEDREWDVVLHNADPSALQQYAPRPAAVLQAGTTLPTSGSRQE